MLTFFDTNKNCTRRDFLTVGSLAGLSLLTGKGSAVEPRRPLTTGKSVIMLMMHGGPSQIETWDPKMNMPANNRSVTGEVQTTVPGLTFGGTFHRLAQRAHKLAVVRNYSVENGNHDIKPVVSPHSLGANLGSIYARVAGTLKPNGMPTNVAIFPNSVDARGPGARNNFGNFLATGSMGASFSPFVPGAGGQMQQNMTLNLSRERLDDRRALLGQIDGLRRQLDASGSMAAVDRFHDQAHDVILSGIARAFDLSREDQRLVSAYDTEPFDRPAGWAHKNNRNNYTAHSRSLGKLLLLARRLCEAGCGFVLINTEFVWDMHQDNNNLGVTDMDYVGAPFDHAVANYIDDVEARGLSDDILLVATGEMGRTPRVQANGGRDHWGRITPLIMHGGGLTHGQVIGQSNRDGGEPASNPQRIPNLISTIMHTLFHVGDVRLASGLPTDVNRIITEAPPIPGLFS